MARQLGVAISLAVVGAIVVSMCPRAVHALGPTAYSPPVDAPVVDGFRPPPTPYGRGNRGLEYSVVDRTVVRAAGDGEVIFAGQVAGTLHVTVLHADGLRTSYSFLTEIAVARGSVVESGRHHRSCAGATALRCAGRVGHVPRSNPVVRWWASCSRSARARCGGGTAPAREPRTRGLPATRSRPGREPIATGLALCRRAASGGSGGPRAGAVGAPVGPAAAVHVRGRGAAGPGRSAHRGARGRTRVNRGVGVSGSRRYRGAGCRARRRASFLVCRRPSTRRDRQSLLRLDRRAALRRGRYRTRSRAGGRPARTVARKPWRPRLPAYRSTWWATPRAVWWLVSPSVVPTPKAGCPPRSPAWRHSPHPTAAPIWPRRPKRRGACRPRPARRSMPPATAPTPSRSVSSAR